MIFSENIEEKCHSTRILPMDAACIWPARRRAGRRWSGGGGLKIAAAVKVMVQPIDGGADA
ncbi:hypothetical protein [Bradyrhizobium sp. Ai1a-2]|uniref:hypothetical protein n=1 Tax=Bradyrhizobium sp. Ai1a-2 TaxID=196490 RepID=UPI0004867120|nr:hypothetical protein [Bradyrhizobium sp. Ai1a-2]